MTGTGFYILIGKRMNEFYLFPEAAEKTGSFITTNLAAIYELISDAAETWTLNIRKFEKQSKH